MMDAPTLNMVAVPGLKSPSFLPFSRTTSASFVNMSSLPLTAAANELRHDFDPDTGDYLGLLLEDSSTNIATYSQPLYGAGTGWVQDRSAATPNATIAPDGTNTALLLTDTNTGVLGKHNTRKNFVGYSPTLPWASSVWVKQPATNAVGYASIDTYTTGTTYNHLFVSFDLLSLEPYVIVNGASQYIDCGIKAYPNGWFRMFLVCIPDPTNSGTGVRTDYGYNSTSNPQSIFTGVECMYFWGGQMEQAYTMGSYIRADAAATTRTQDSLVVSSPLSRWFNATQGTLFIKCAYADLSAARTSFCIDDGTASNQIALGLSGSPVAHSLKIVSGGTTNLDLAISGAATSDTVKVAATYANNDFAGCVNGGTVYTSNSGGLPSGLNAARVGSLASSLQGRLLQLTYFPYRMSNADLQRITQ